MFVIRFFILLLFHTSILLASHTNWPVNPNWSIYFNNTKDWEKPHPTLVEAIKNLTDDGIKEGISIDLGCGAGKDTIFLLDLGWHVFAVDAEKEALEITASKVHEKSKSLFSPYICTFNEFEFPIQQIDLVNATKALPFCIPEEFPTVWKKITQSLKIGGRFAGQFFGDRDEWASIANRSHFCYEDVMGLLSKNYEIELFQKEEGFFPTAGGVMKKWHIFHVVAKKIR